jgi:lysophospholipase L1-like esterase
MYIDFDKKNISIPFYANLQTDILGMDSKEHCFGPELFDTWPPVTYQFNEIGFRTHSVNQFKSDAILVIGDSFTLGLGVNSVDRFSDVIEQHTGHQVLNFSLNGASNDWISRKLQQLLPLFRPRAIIVHYTFSHRRERPFEDWHDDERTECEPFYSSEENYQNWLTNFDNIYKLAGDTKLIHSFITNWHDIYIDYQQFGPNILPPQTQLDYARDGFHYGSRTHRLIADKITSLLGDELHQSL